MEAVPSSLLCGLAELCASTTLQNGSEGPHAKGAKLAKTAPMAPLECAGKARIAGRDGAFAVILMFDPGSVARGFEA
jgi:hypothetical protein